MRKLLNATAALSALLVTSMAAHLRASAVQLDGILSWRQQRGVHWVEPATDAVG
jgi:hypothetical protein